MARFSNELTIPEAAGRLGITEEEVRLLVRRHILPSQLRTLATGGMDRVVPFHGIERLEEQGVKNALQQVQQEEAQSAVARLRREEAPPKATTVETAQPAPAPSSDPGSPKEEKPASPSAQDSAYQIATVQGLAVVQERLQQLDTELRTVRETLPDRVIKEMNLPALEQRWQQRLDVIGAEVGLLNAKLDALRTDLIALSEKLGSVKEALDEFNTGLQAKEQKSPIRQIKKFIGERSPER